eukprot:PLAT15966.1.p2 GENE.PLAT15966.1~~PLAT15966.1.p2  ORF type:complete len:260 (+),score=160.43 PLAT15966.1:36-815(+)
MADLAEFQRLLQEEAEPFTAASEALLALKVHFTTLPSLPPTLEETATAVDDRVLARATLEGAVLLDVKRDDSESMNRHMAQLKVYYGDLADSLPPSDAQASVLGLYLLHLLVANELPRFHSELELLTMEQRSWPCVQFPIKIEEHLAEGSYNRAVALLKDVPDAEYARFVQPLMQTVREEIADCMEVAYRPLQLEEAAALLKFGDDAAAMEDFVASRDGWAIADGSLTFDVVEESTMDIPAARLISETLGYATEMERIV